MTQPSLQPQPPTSAQQPFNQLQSPPSDPLVQPRVPSPRIPSPILADAIPQAQAPSPATSTSDHIAINDIKQEIKVEPAAVEIKSEPDVIKQEAGVVKSEPGVNGIGNCSNSGKGSIEPPAENRTKGGKLEMKSEAAGDKGSVKMETDNDSCVKELKQEQSSGEDSMGGKPAAATNPGKPSGPVPVTKEETKQEPPVTPTASSGQAEVVPGARARTGNHKGK